MAALQAPLSLGFSRIPGDLSTGVGCHFLLQPKSLVEGIGALLWGDPLISTDRPHLKSSYGQDDTPLQIWGPILLEKALPSLSSHRWNVGTT